MQGMKPYPAAALALIGCYLLLPPWVARDKFDAHAPLSKWKKSGKFETEDACTLTRSALIDWYVDHPEAKDASWFRRYYSASRCLLAHDPGLT
jgi:hypothetical protein